MVAVRGGVGNEFAGRVSDSGTVAGNFASRYAVSPLLVKRANQLMMQLLVKQKLVFVTE